MSDLPVSSFGSPPIITNASLEALGANTAIGNMTGWASQTWPNNNDARYYPFTLYDITTVYQLFWYVGATQSGNIDVAIYDAQKNRIVSAGSTAMSATINTVQTLNITDTVLMPGDYLMGGACSLATGTIFASVGGADEITLPNVCVYAQATAMALPDPAVPVISTSSTEKFYGFGAICRSVY